MFVERLSVRSFREHYLIMQRLTALAIHNIQEDANQSESGVSVNGNLYHLQQKE